MDIVTKIQESSPELTTLVFSFIIVFITWLIKTLIEKPIENSRNTFVKYFEKRVQILSELNANLHFIAYFPLNTEFKENLQKILLDGLKSAYISKEIFDNTTRIAIDETTNDELTLKTIKKIENQFASKEKGAVNMVIMLPFGFDSNNNKYKNLALDFLAGAKMAAERSLKNGKKININVIDSESETAVKNSLEQINKSNTDIIIGPFFKSNVLEVSDHVRKEKIPVIAPFAHASDMYNQENLILVETSVRTYTEKIIQEVKQVYSGQKIYIIGEKDNEEVAYLKEQFEKVLSKADVAVSASASGIELEENMMTGQKLPIIMVLATDKEDTGTAFSKKIIQLVSQSDGIKAFSMYYNSNFEKNIDELSKSNLVYLMDRKINVEGSFEKEVLEDFKKKYCKTPSKYNIIGFDVVNDALERQQAGGFLKNIDKVQTQLATKFEYVRTKRNGAYANTGYRVVRLIP